MIAGNTFGRKTQNNAVSIRRSRSIFTICMLWMNCLEERLIFPISGHNYIRKA
jgi:hypothetical protein